MCAFQRSPLRIQNAFHLLLLVVLYFPLCHSFASWLVERKSSCYVFLRDKSEVIMNNKIKLVDESSHRKEIFIEVSDADTMEPIDYNIKDDGTRVIPIHQSSIGGEDTRRYHLRLVSPPDLKDLQYVMDAVIFPESDGEELHEGNEERMTVQFTSLTRGCGDKRAHGRKNDDGLIIELTVPSSTFNAPDDTFVDVVAGWACGHEAVTLTHPVQFIPVVNNQQAIEQNTEKEHETDNTKEEEDTDDKDLPEIPGSIFVEPDEKDAIKDDFLIKDNTNLRRGRRYERGVATLDSERIDETLDTDGIVKKLKIDHDRESYGHASFSMISYFVGISTLLFLGVSATVFLIYKSKPGTKEL